MFVGYACSKVFGYWGSLTQLLMCKQDWERDTTKYKYRPNEWKISQTPCWKDLLISAYCSCGIHKQKIAGVGGQTSIVILGTLQDNSNMSETWKQNHDMLVTIYGSYFGRPLNVVFLIKYKMVTKMYTFKLQTSIICKIPIVCGVFK